MSANGKWTVTADSPLGRQTFGLRFKIKGARFSGVISSPMGSQDIEGAIAGDTLTWTTEMLQPMKLTIEYSATVSGETIAGTIKAGAFGAFPFSGERG